MNSPETTMRLAQENNRLRYEVEVLRAYLVDTKDALTQGEIGRAKAILQIALDHHPKETPTQ